MSTFGGGNPSNEFDKLIALAQFVQTDQYLPRVQELRALEASAKEAAEHATHSAAEADAKHKALDKKQAKLDHDVDKFHRERDEHRHQVSKDRAEIAKSREDLTRHDKTLETAIADHRRDKASWMSAKTRLEQEFAAREAGISSKERQLGELEARLAQRIAKIKAATDE